MLRFRGQGECAVHCAGAELKQRCRAGAERCRSGAEQVQNSIGADVVQRGCSCSGAGAGAMVVKWWWSIVGANEVLRCR